MINKLIVYFWMVFLPISLFSNMVCDESSIKSYKEYRIKGTSINVRVGAGANYSKVINKKASDIFKRKMYVTVDKSVKVIEECTKGNWSKIKVIEPEYLSKSHKGWILSKYLRKWEKNSEFTEEDFYFGEKEKPYKDIIIKGVNYIKNNHASCKKYIDAGSASKSSYKGTKKNPVFFVTCGKGAKIVNIFFSKVEVERKSIKKSITHINRDSAIKICRGFISSKIRHLSTLNFNTFGLSVYNAPNGNTRVTQEFTAKNSFNLELKNVGTCLINKKGFIEGNIKEIR